jgi:hypothetical protein
MTYVFRPRIHLVVTVYLFLSTSIYAQTVQDGQKDAADKYGLNEKNSAKKSTGDKLAKAVADPGGPCKDCAPPTDPCILNPKTCKSGHPQKKTSSDVLSKSPQEIK